MVLDGLLGQTQSVRDLLVAEALGHQLEDLSLAVGELVVRSRPRCPQLAQHAPCQRRRHVDVAGDDGTDHACKLAPAGALEHVAGRPGLHRREQVVLVLGDREHDDPSGRAGGGDAPCC